MSGYRNKTEIYGDDDDPVQRSAWLKRALVVCGYGALLLWLWIETDYPDSFGLDLGSGKGAVLENWYYSYLLLQRHTLFDVATFVTMWAPVAGLILWLVLPSAFRRAKNSVE